MNTLRTMSERLARKLVIKRRLPQEFLSTPFYVAGDTALQYLKPKLPTQELFDIVQKFVSPGSVVWDVGANAGVFTFAAAARGGENGQVVAIEADIYLANILRRSTEISENKKLNVVVLPVAASDEHGIARLLIAQRGRASNTLERSGHRSQAGGTRYVQYTPTITLDSLLDKFEAPHLIKIDVEGAEQFVLKGATKVLSNHRPVIYCEVGKEQDEEITQILHSHDYLLYDPENMESGEQSHCFYNTLALPQEANFKA